MVTEVVMPKMGQTMERGTIIKWLKKDGEEVKKGEPLLEIETDKTTIEVEARDSGTLKILAQEGEEVPIAKTIAYIIKKGEPAPEVKISEQLKPKEGEAAAVRRVKASPLARKIAKEEGVDLTQVMGTGPGGRITKEDVLAYLKRRAEVSPAEAVSAEFVQAEYEVVPMSSMRRAIAMKMVKSKMQVPHFYVSVQVDMTEAARLREGLNSVIETKSGVRLSFTHLLVKAVASALEKYPQLNATCLLYTSPSPRD